MFPVKLGLLYFRGLHYVLICYIKLLHFTVIVVFDDNMIRRPFTET